MLPVSGEQHEVAVQKAIAAFFAGRDDTLYAVLDAYFASLAAQGVRLVDRGVFVREIAEWLREVRSEIPGGNDVIQAVADLFLRRFGGGDERPCAVCGAGPQGRCALPDHLDCDSCPHGCCPER